MKTRIFTLTMAQEQYAIETALSKCFKGGYFNGTIEEKHANRCWLQFTARSLAVPYQKLTLKELSWLLEQKIVALLEEIYCGHAFSVSVRVTAGENRSKGRLETFQIRVYIEPLREGVLK